MRCLRHSLFWQLRTRLSRKAPIPCPKRQLDRFLLQVDVTYPDAAAERRMLYSTTSLEDRTVIQVLNAEEVMAAQRLMQQLPTGDDVVDAILKLAFGCRASSNGGSRCARR